MDTDWYQTVDNGVTIDLGLMNQTTYNTETQVASIPPGTRWRGVYEALDPLNVTVPGGRAASVGVAGFLSGGGNSFYSARKGFACDNVVNFEVVLASGEVINANATDNTDLFQALKGGQSNFGVITRFDMQGFDAPLLWGGVVQYNKTTGPQQIDAYVNWTANLNNFTQGSAILFWSYQPSLKDIIIIEAYDDTTGAVAASGYDEFLAIPNNLSSTLRIASHLELTNELEQPTGYRDIWFTATIRNDKLVYEKVVELHEELCDFSKWLFRIWDLATMINPTGNSGSAIPRRRLCDPGYVSGHPNRLLPAQRRKRRQRAGTRPRDRKRGHATFHSGCQWARAAGGGRGSDETFRRGNDDICRKHRVVG